MEKKLNDKGYSSEVVTQVLDEIIEKKYLREDYYAEARIKGFMHKGYSPTSIKLKLKEEFVDVDKVFIEKIFNEYETNPANQVKKLIEKKTRHAPEGSLVDFNFRKKLLRYLVSKGHSLNVANNEIERIIRGEHEENDDYI